MQLALDRYTWRARVLPVYLTAAPAVLAIATTLPDGLNLPLAGASAIVFLPLSYFLSQVRVRLWKATRAGPVAFLGWPADHPTPPSR